MNQWLEQEWTNAADEVLKAKRMIELDPESGSVYLPFNTSLNYWTGYLDAITNTQNELSGMSKE
jgi:hypothetical protein